MLGETEDEIHIRRIAHVAKQMMRAKLDEIDARGAIEDGDALEDDDREFLASCNIKWVYNPEEHDNDD